MSDADLTALRADIREWLAVNCPTSIRRRGSEFPAWGGRHPVEQCAESLQWLTAMAERGYIAPTWSTDYGGAGLDEVGARVLAEELRSISAPAAIYSFGLWMLAPILFEYGTEAQRRAFLPPIARGKIRWCQGYSEPNAGSDLAALQTRCEDRGDHWLINGQKIWTSDAHLSDWMFCLVRTDRSVKQGGISFVLIDMQTPGIDRRPIKLISGVSPFCETFFSDVKVPKDHMVGPLNGGWEIAKRLLQYERRAISSAQFHAQEPLHEEVARRRGLLDSRMRGRIARQEMREHALDLTLTRASGEGGVSHLASALKVAGSIVRQDRQEILVDALGLQSLVEEGESGSWAFGTTDVSRWLRSRSATIEGGTTEINLNVIARHILRLPDAE